MKKIFKVLYKITPLPQKTKLRIKNSILGTEENDADYLDSDVPISTIAGHLTKLEYLADNFNKKGMRVLEIGSREVTGPSQAREIFDKAEYVGFDYYPGKNVDMVGDAHKLSEYFQNDEKFDLIYSFACFEHFAMPWIVALEIPKVLKVGGTLLIETHFSYSSHERPWHFFQFSDMALKLLFSKDLGFECIEAGMSNPMIGRFSSLADEYLRNQPIPGLYCHSNYLGRKIKDVDNFKWDDVSLDSVVEGTKYPKPAKNGI